MGHNMRVYFQPAFLICVAVLATSELVIKPILGVAIPDKEPLPLKKPLDLLDEEDLSPYKVISKTKIGNEEIVKELGTQDYIQWVLEDTDVSSDSAVRKLLLFITYYELPDKVPHVPEECYTGGGFQRMASGDRVISFWQKIKNRLFGLEDSITFEINNNAGFAKSIRGKYIVFGTTNFSPWRSKWQFPVLYFFRVNGEYADSRGKARITLNKNIFGKFSYFCKVELVFNQSSVIINGEEALATSQKLLGVILPILEAKYWPDWKKGG